MRMAETEDPLERFFEAGRRTAAVPSEALLARIEADGLAEAERRATPAAAQSNNGFGAVLAALGGWRTGAGLATAALAGIVLGIGLEANLGALDSLGIDATGYELGDFGPGYGVALLEEG